MIRHLLLGIIGLILCAALSNAEQGPAQNHNIEKVRKFYREHGLDFFGELIADQSGLLEDEKRHAKLELLADDARSKALAQLEKLMKSGQGEEMQIELLTRKATLLADRARTASFFQNGTFKAKNLKAPKYYLEESIETFQSIEKRWERSGKSVRIPRMDTVLFSIAYNYGELGTSQVDRAFQYYGKLVKEFPDSSLVGDARLAMAEILFEKRNFKGSLMQLQEIVKSDHPRLKNFALYKMAWTYYNMAELESAITALEKVVEGVNALGIQRSRLELRKEALHDLVGFYSERTEKDAARESQAYFERIARTPDSILTAYRTKKNADGTTTLLPVERYELSEPNQMLLRLTNVYRDQGKHENSMIVAGLLIDTIGRHPKTPSLYRLRAEAAEKLRRRTEVLAELERLTKTMESDLPVVEDYEDGLPVTEVRRYTEIYSSGGTAKVTWAEQAKAPQEKSKEELSDEYIKELSKVGFETLKDFANFYHGEWSKTHSLETGRHALVAYDMAVRALLTPWRGHSMEASLKLREQRAHLSFALAQWDKAAEDFKWLSIRVSASNADAMVRGEIASLEAWLKASPMKLEKGSLGPVHQRLVESYDRFLAYYLVSKSTSESRKMAAGVLAASARLYRDSAQSEKALERMKYYSTNFHDEKDAIGMTRDVLAQLEGLTRWEELRDFSDGLLQSAKYKSTEVQPELTRTYEFASLKLLEIYEKEKNWGKASRGFAEFAKRNPHSSFTPQALLKAARASLELHEYPEAVAHLEAATKVQDRATKLQALLGLEPFYRRAYQFEKLERLYQEVLKLGPDAKTRSVVAANLEGMRKLQSSRFAQQSIAIADDQSLEQWLQLQTKFEAQVKPFKALRFAKSNRNPQDNFKKKADLHRKLVELSEKTASKAPPALIGTAMLWSNIVKAELFLEFAETLKTAALPSVLAQASEVDKKAYKEAIDSNAAELLENAKSATEASLKLVSQVDCPVELGERLDALLPHFISSKQKIARMDFAKVWKDRPGLKPEARDKNEVRETLEEQAQKIWKSMTSADRSGIEEDMEKPVFRIAEAYFGAAEMGYAYSVSSELLEAISSNENSWKNSARRLQFEADTQRLPSKLLSSATSNSFDMRSRWALARWIAGYGVDCEKKGFSSSDCEWFEQATRALLRFESSETILSKF